MMSPLPKQEPAARKMGGKAAGKDESSPQSSFPALNFPALGGGDYMAHNPYAETGKLGGIGEAREGVVQGGAAHLPESCCTSLPHHGYGPDLPAVKVQCCLA